MFTFLRNTKYKKEKNESSYFTEIPMEELNIIQAASNSGNSLTEQTQLKMGKLSVSKKKEWVNYC